MIFFACGGEQRMVNSTQELLCLLTNHRRRQNSRISSKKLKFFQKNAFWDKLLRVSHGGVGTLILVTMMLWKDEKFV